MNHCAYCHTKLPEDNARFEVRVAPDLPRRDDYCAGVYCSAPCWEAERTKKSVDCLAKRLIADAEAVLPDEGKLGGRNRW